MPGENQGELHPIPFWASIPYDGTLLSASAGTSPTTPTNAYGTPRDRAHCYPFLVAEPPVGVKWRLDTVIFTNVSLGGETAYVSASLSNVAQVRPWILSANNQLYGTALTPTTHFAIGMPLPAGETEVIDTGGLLVIGRSAAGAVDGQGLWAACIPGLQPATGWTAGNPADPRTPGAVVSFNGVVLA